MDTRNAQLPNSKIPKPLVFFLVSIFSLTWYFILFKYLTYNQVKDVFKLGNWNINLHGKLSLPTARLNTSSIYEVRPLLSKYDDVRNFLPPETDLEDKYIIYRCNSSRLCGGLADRQKGIVTSYVISQMLRRKFGIIMDKGCKLSNYVIPNEVNWLIDEGTLKGRSIDKKRLIDNRGMARTIRDKQLKEMFDKDVTYYEGNMDYVNCLMNKTSFKSLKWTRNRNHYDIYRIAFAHLFKFSTYTRKRYDKFLEKTANASLVCAHLRMGSSKTIPLDDPRGRRKPHQEAVVQFLKRKVTNGSKVFIATDSDEVRARMETEFPNNFIELKGKIVHIDRYRRKYDCSGLEKAILDQYILSTCDTLIMSISGFSRVAAILRGTDDQLYLAGPRNITKTKRLDPVHPHKLC